MSRMWCLYKSGCRELPEVRAFLPDPTGNVQNFTESQPLQLLQSGKMLNDIRVLRPLSMEPSIVNVYRAEQDGVKVLLKETRIGSENEKQLSQSHEILSSVASASLPVSLSCFKAEGGFYQLLGEKTGRLLQEVWTQSDDEHRLIWIKQLCEAIFLINQQGGLCLQILPSNLYVSEQGNLFIADLLLLRRLPISESDRIPSNYHVAPEVYSNREDLSQRADVFAIGAVWLSLYLGKQLEQTHYDERNIKLLTDLFSPDFLLPSINRLISKAIHRSLEKRYKSVYLMGKAVENALNDLKNNNQLLLKYSQSPNLAAWTDMGLSRDNNEDNFYADNFKKESGNFTVLMVADGMGGEEGGEVASSLALECIKEVLPSHLEFLLKSQQRTRLSPVSNSNQPTVLVQPNPNRSTLPDTGLKESLERALGETISEASKRIFDRAQREPKLKSMGSTIVLAVVVNNQVAVANVGDSRAYLIREGRLVQISQEHTRIAEMRLKNKEPRPEDESRLQGVLSRNLGYRAAAESFVAFYPVQSGDFLLLCCDGLTDSLTDDQIAQLVYGKGQSSLLGNCFGLINSAIATSGHDNTTVVLYRHP